MRNEDLHISNDKLVVFEGVYVRSSVEVSVQKCVKLLKRQEVSVL